MVTEDDTKWPRKSFPEVPARFGKLKENEYLSFDASFFQVHGKQAAVSSPTGGLQAQDYLSVLMTRFIWNNFH